MGVRLKIDKLEITAYIEGDIDHHTAREIRENIDAAILSSHPTLLYLDFGAVSFMDSSGVGLILGRYKIMQSINGNIRVINAPPIIGRMLKLAGISKLKMMEEKYEKIS